jgi:SulP family sulfate permease
MSSAEAFVRIHRLLAAKYVTLVFCGFTIDSPVGNALRSVDVLGADGVELFLTFNDAIECMLCFGRESLSSVRN